MQPEGPSKTPNPAQAKIVLPRADFAGVLAGEVVNLHAVLRFIKGILSDAYEFLLADDGPKDLRLATFNAARRILQTIQPVEINTRAEAAGAVDNLERLFQASSPAASTRRHYTALKEVLSFVKKDLLRDEPGQEIYRMTLRHGFVEAFFAIASADANPDLSFIEGLFKTDSSLKMKLHIAEKIGDLRELLGDRVRQIEMTAEPASAGELERAKNAEKLFCSQGLEELTKIAASINEPDFSPIGVLLPYGEEAVPSMIGLLRDKKEKAIEALKKGNEGLMDDLQRNLLAASVALRSLRRGAYDALDFVADEVRDREHNRCMTRLSLLETALLIAAEPPSESSDGSGLSPTNNTTVVKNRLATELFLEMYEEIVRNPHKPPHEVQEAFRSISSRFSFPYSMLE